VARVLAPWACKWLINRGIKFFYEVRGAAGPPHFFFDLGIMKICS
jgi:hypothetical protein